MLYVYVQNSTTSIGALVSKARLTESSSSGSDSDITEQDQSQGMNHIACFKTSCAIIKFSWSNLCMSRILSTFIVYANLPGNSYSLLVIMNIVTS